MVWVRRSCPGGPHQDRDPSRSLPLKLSSFRFILNPTGLGEILSGRESGRARAPAAPHAVRPAPPGGVVDARMRRRARRARERERKRVRPRARSWLHGHAAVRRDADARGAARPRARHPAGVRGPAAPGRRRADRRAVRLLRRRALRSGRGSTRAPADGRAEGRRRRRGGGGGGGGGAEAADRASEGGYSRRGRKGKG